MTADPFASRRLRQTQLNGGTFSDGDPRHRVAEGAAFTAARWGAAHEPQSIEKGTTAVPAGAATAAEKAAAEKVLRSFNTWAFKREQPADPELMREIVSEAIALQEPISFVLYWGKGPRCRLAEPELHCLDYLARLAHRVSEVHAPGAAIKLIFTDTHAELNGHTQSSIQRYFATIEPEARRRNFDTCWLSELTALARSKISGDLSDEVVPEELLQRLSVSASKWFRGHGTPEEAARRYYKVNMLEKRAVETAFPQSIFVTFNGSELRSLFPTRLPIFYMYSLRRGVSVKPWFFQTGNTPCHEVPCECILGSSDAVNATSP